MSEKINADHYLHTASLDVLGKTTCADTCRRRNAAISLMGNGLTPAI